jgi:hypothetical protein
MSVIPNASGGDLMSHVHPSLQRRIRLFLVMGGVMLLLVLWDIVRGLMSVPLALVGLLVGAFVGFFSSRIFHLSWDHDGKQVVGRIDIIGWLVLALYVAFEIARATLFEDVIHTGFSATAITFAFIASAFIFRVLGLRGRISRILEEERVFK